MQQGVQEGTMVLAAVSAGFQSLPSLPTSKVGPLALIPVWVILCTFWDPVGLSKELSCEAGSFSHCHFNPQGVFHWWFEALFPRAGALGCLVCLTPKLFLLVYLHVNVGPPAPPATALPAQSSSHCLATSPLCPAARLCPSYGSG